MGSGNCLLIVSYLMKNDQNLWNLNQNLQNWIHQIKSKTTSEVNPLKSGSFIQTTGNVPIQAPIQFNTPKSEFSSYFHISHMLMLHSVGTYNSNEENNEIYFFSNPRQREKWRAETGTEEVITDNGEVIGYKRRLAYTGNADNLLKWHMQEYMNNEHDLWAVYKLYTTTVKTRIEGNPTGTISSHTSSDIGSSQCNYWN